MSRLDVDPDRLDAFRAELREEVRYTLLTGERPMSTARRRRRTAIAMRAASLVLVVGAAALLFWPVSNSTTTPAEPVVEAPVLTEQARLAAFCSNWSVVDDSLRRRAEPTVERLERASGGASELVESGQRSADLDDREWAVVRTVNALLDAAAASAAVGRLEDAERHESTARLRWRGVETPAACPGVVAEVES